MNILVEYKNYGTFTLRNLSWFLIKALFVIKPVLILQQYFFLIDKPVEILAAIVRDFSIKFFVVHPGSDWFLPISVHSTASSFPH